MKIRFLRTKEDTLYTNFNQKIRNRILKKKFNNIDDKIVYRKKNSLTGIHGDNKTWKVISCLSGKIELVLVNCKKNSKNFGKHTKFNLKR